MSRKFSWDQLKEACQHLSARNKIGHWDKIPEIFHVFRKLYDLEEDVNWLLVVEGIIHRAAIDYIANEIE